MRTHPVFLRLEGRRCVILGGDAAAAGKALACKRAGAEVVVIGAAPGPEMAALVAAGHVAHTAREPLPGDLTGAFVAYASTRDPDRIASLAAEAARERVLLNVIDVPDACTFFAPAVVDRGDLQIAVGTGGASPGLAACLRRELEAGIGPEYAAFVGILGAVRRALASHPGRARVLAELLESPLLDLVRSEAWADVDTLLGRIVGTEITLARLGVGRDLPP